jgi:hypothetical protein
MAVDAALEVLCGPDSTHVQRCDALGAMGADLFHTAGLGPSTLMLVTDTAGMLLRAGVTHDDQHPRTWVARPVGHGYLRSRFSVDWVAGPPPGDQPLAIFVAAIIQGLALRALLYDLVDHGHHAPITALAMIATPEGLAVIGAAHPQVKVVVAHRAAGVDRHGNVEPAPLAAALATLQRSLPGLGGGRRPGPSTSTGSNRGDR